MKLTTEQQEELKKFIEYEITGSRWNHLFGLKWIMNLIAAYYMRKAKRKYARYLYMQDPLRLKQKDKTPASAYSIPEDPAFEEMRNGLRLGEQVPDEDEVPEEQLAKIPEQTQTGIESISPFIPDAEIDAATIPEGKYNLVPIPEPGEHKSHKRGPRGPYKKKNPVVPEPKKETRGRKPKDYKPPVRPEPSYLSQNTIIAVKGGEEICLRGVQATKAKFIVANTYFYGKLDIAREQYRIYISELIESDKPILSWASWLVEEFNQKKE